MLIDPKQESSAKPSSQHASNMKDAAFAKDALTDFSIFEVGREEILHSDRWNSLMPKHIK